MIKSSQMCLDAWFCYDSDYIARVFGNYLYCIDEHSNNLHVYSIKEKMWNYSALKELGINWLISCFNPSLLFSTQS